MYLQNEVDVAQLADMRTHTKCVEDEKNFKAKNQCLQLKSICVIYCLSPWPWSAPSLTTMLAVLSNQSAHFHPSSPCQCMAARFGNVCLCQNTQREGKKQHAKEKEKTKTQINFSGRSTLNSELDSENQCSSNTQIHKPNDHHRNCKQVRDYPQSAEILPVE